jgi:hypothetical protein
MISYIKTLDKTTSVKAAEKIKVFILDEMVSNPFLAHRATPSKAEGLSSGGGMYIFRTPLGNALPTRRIKANTNNNFEYKGYISNSEVKLSVSQPLETEIYPMDRSDIVQSDGIDYSNIVAKEISVGLMKKEILVEAEAV